MDIDLFFKKVYTVAFRLTGEDGIAQEIAAQAIIHTFKEFNKYYKVTENMLQMTIIELVKIFLSRSDLHFDYSINGIQRALLELKPLSRAVVVWKDLLGYKIHDNIPVDNCTSEELYKELVCGRKELNEYMRLY